jgi:hypothetical protein
LVLAGFVLAGQGTSPTKQGPGCLPKVAGPWKENAWVSRREVRAGGRGAGDTSLSMPLHVEILEIMHHVCDARLRVVNMALEMPYTCRTITQQVLSKQHLALFRFSYIGAYVIAHIHIYREREKDICIMCMA